MIRIADLEARRKNILGAIIESFIANSFPISSEFIAKEFNFGLSSATIRNAMADLEEMEFITHPHTSAGRIPTDKGYRFYVDNILGHNEIQGCQKEMISKELDFDNLDISEFLEKASDMLARLSHYPSLVSFTDWEHKIYFNGTSFIFEHPEFNDIKKLRALFGALEEKENLLKTINQNIEEPLKIYIGQENIIDEMKDCTMIISTYKRKARPAGRIAVLGPTRLRYSQVIPLIEYTSCLLSDFFGEIDE
ncbi:MAG: hypothetical protein AB1755_01755 [Candidatus Omnitrophota bacterium]